MSRRRRSRFALSRRAKSATTRSLDTRLHLELLEDRRLLAVEPISVVHAGLQGDSGDRASGVIPNLLPPAPTRSWVSADGQRVVFHSDASNLTANDFNGQQDVFVRDLASGTTSLVSIALSGTSSSDFGHASNPMISADGRFVAFESSRDAAEFVPGVVDAFGHGDYIFIRDLMKGETRLVTYNHAAAQLGEVGSWT